MFKDTRAYSGFSVNDMQQAKAFYGQTLGLEVSEAGGNLELQVAGGTKILVYPKSDHTPATFTIGELGEVQRGVFVLLRGSVKAGNTCCGWQSGRCTSP